MDCILVANSISPWKSEGSIFHTFGIKWCYWFCFVSHTIFLFLAFLLLDSKRGFDLTFNLSSFSWLDLDTLISVSSLTFSLFWIEASDLTFSWFSYLGLEPVKNTKDRLINNHKKQRNNNSEKKSYSWNESKNDPCQNCLILNRTMVGDIPKV